MKRVVFLKVLLLAAVSVMAAETPRPKDMPQRITSETDEQRAARIAEWQADRFGMFIHFGLFAMPATHEWVKAREAIDDDIYSSKYLSRFNPDLFDARAWVKCAKAAGMKYVVLTTKHHEGFCLWDTATTDYKITNTPFGRDLVKEYVEACRAEGMKVGFYFSLPDWHSPDYLVCHPHPLLYGLKAKGLKDKELDAEVAKLNATRDMAKFRKMMFSQVTELLTRYGKIDILWFDFVPTNFRDFDSVELLRLVRRLQPQVVIDERLGLVKSDDGWDFLTAEGKKPEKHLEVRGKPVPWERCEAFGGGSWGYKPCGPKKSAHQLLEMLIHSVSLGGNLLLNVGPNSRGEIDPRFVARFEEIGGWMHLNSRSIYGCTEAPSEFKAPEGTLLTWNPKTRLLYLHLLDYPKADLKVEFFDRIAYAQFLHDGAEVGLDAKTGSLIRPEFKPICDIPVVEIWLKD